MTNREYLLSTMSDRELACHLIRFNPYYHTIEVNIPEFHNQDYDLGCVEISDLVIKVGDWLRKERK